MATAIPKGHFVWYDLLTPKPQDAIAFYTKLLGWGTEVWKGPVPYTMWTVQGKTVGGIMDLPAEASKAGMPPHWMAYITTPDVDATTKQATSIGGRVLMPPMEIPEVGRFSTIADPDGAVFAAYTPKQMPATLDDGMKAGMQRFSWNELNTRDPKKAIGFYGALFGWKTTNEMDMGPQGVYAIYGRNGQDLGGMYAGAITEKSAPPSWIFYVHVPDINQALSQTTALGGKVHNGPMEVPGGVMTAICADPQGAHFALLMPPKPKP